MSKKKLPRHYYFAGEVNDETVTKARNKILRWAESGGEITLDIRSQGGYMETGLDLFGVLRFASERRGCHVTTVVSGIAASMAGVLAQAGDHRAMREHSWLMIHEASSGTWDTSSGLLSHANHTARMTRQVAEIFCQRTDEITTDMLLARIKGDDLYLSSHEALELGFIDEII